MIPCDEARLLLSDRLDGALEAVAAPRLDEHLAGCERCRAHAESLDRVDAVVRGLPAPTPRTDPWPAVRERLREAARRRTVRRTWAVVVAALGVAAACAVGWWVVRRAPELPMPLPTITPAPRPVDLTFLHEPETYATLARLQAGLVDGPAEADTVDLVENAGLLLEEAASEQPVAADVVRLVREADLRARLRESARRAALGAELRQDLERVCDMLDRLAAAPEGRS